MPDIELRLGHDMLVLSAPIDMSLARQGIDASRDRQYLNLMEPDAIADALRLELLAGAHCLVTTTEDITRARLAHVRMEEDAVDLAQAATGIASGLKPQHVLAEIGPCGLPLDAASAASLNENRAQYAGAARAFEGCEFDAFFLNGFASLPDLKCALMGLAQVSGKPVMASVTLGEDAGLLEGANVPLRELAPFSDADAIMFSLGYEAVEGPIAPAVPKVRAVLDPALWPDAIAIMQDLGASVVGFETAEPLDKAIAYARVAAGCTGAPLLAQMCVTQQADEKAHVFTPLESRTDYSVETMERTAASLYAEGVQFLRATGLATPAYTGALAATVAGLDVHRS